MMTAERVHGDLPMVVDAYYSRKDPEYISKYGLSGRVHIHVAHFSQAEQSELFRPGWISPNLGEDFLRSLIREGQDRTSSMLLSRIGGKLDNETVLDCGAGLGGTSWILAERYGCTVTALTASRDQADYIEKQAKELGVDSKVRPKLGNVFSADWGNGPYSVIVSIDAMCQMGKYPQLLRRLSDTQCQGGLIAVSDYFARSEDEPIARRLNDYWVSDISTVEVFLNGLAQAGYELVSLNDTTDEQVPYWDLSIAMSQLELEGWTAERRDESQAFHKEMRAAFCDRAMRYFQIVAEKRGSRI